MLSAAGYSCKFRLRLAEIGGKTPMEVQGFQIGFAAVDIKFIVVEQCCESQQDAIFDHDAIQRRLVEFDAVVVTRW